MKHVIKTLAARRLAPQRKSFYAVTLGLFVYLAKLWTTYLQESLPQLSSGEGVEPGLVTLEMSRTCLKSRPLLSTKSGLAGMYLTGTHMHSDSTQLLHRYLVCNYTSSKETIGWYMQVFLENISGE